MDSDNVLSQFSKNRLNGEPVPEDVGVLLAHHDELAERTGVRLNGEADWAPWLDTSYLSETERADPNIAANTRAIAEVCGLIAFVASEEDGQYFGYWRGPGKRKAADSPLVFLDNEGQFELCAGKTFAEAVLASLYDEEGFAELRDWFRAIGLTIPCETAKELSSLDDEYPPDKLHHELYHRFGGRS
jgi:hypothetical protein